MNLLPAVCALISCSLVLNSCLSNAAPTTTTDVDSEIELRYDQIFGYQIGPMAPAAALCSLRRLNSLLAGKVDSLSQVRRETIQALIEHSKAAMESDATGQCNMPAAKRLNEALTYYSSGNQWSPTVVQYLAQYADKTAARCKPNLDQLVLEAEQRLRRQRPDNWEMATQLKEAIGREFESFTYTTIHVIRSIFLAFMDKQAGELLDPRLKRERFDELFEQWVASPCDVIVDEFGFFNDLGEVFFKRSSANLRPDWFKAQQVCSSVQTMPEVVSSAVYRYLVSHGQTGLWYNLFGCLRPRDSSRAADVATLPDAASNSAA